MLTINLNCYADSIRSSERLHSYASEFYATLHLLCALSDIQWIFLGFSVHEFASVWQSL